MSLGDDIIEGLQWVKDEMSKKFENCNWKCLTCGRVENVEVIGDVIVAPDCCEFPMTLRSKD